MVNFSNKLKPKIIPFVSIDGVEVNLADIEPGTITLEQYRNARSNTPGLQMLYTKLDNEALMEATRNTLKNCYSRVLDVTYEGALQLFLVPELLKRLEGAAVKPSEQSYKFNRS